MLRYVFKHFYCLQVTVGVGNTDVIRQHFWACPFNFTHLLVTTVFNSSAHFQLLQKDFP